MSDLIPTRQPLVRVFDPNWNADDGGGGKGANAQYETLDVDGISKVIRMSPVWNDVEPMLGFMWATTLAVCDGDAHALANRLNLRICSSLVWAKVTAVDNLDVTLPDGVEAELDLTDEGLFKPVQKLGQGQWVRVEHEFLFLCRRGDAPTIRVPQTRNRQRSIIYSDREGAHSTKPQAAWRRIEAIAAGSLRAAPIDAVELFSRARRPGWGAWGRLDGDDKPARYEPNQEGTAPWSTVS